MAQIADYQYNNKTEAVIRAKTHSFCKTTTKLHIICNIINFLQRYEKYLIDKNIRWKNIHL